MYDREYGWLYVICQERLLRLDVAGLINAGYGVAGNSMEPATASSSGVITPTPMPGGLIEILHDTMPGASKAQTTPQYPQNGWHGYDQRYDFGQALSLVDGVLYWTTRQVRTYTAVTLINCRVN